MPKGDSVPAFGAAPGLPAALGAVRSGPISAEVRARAQAAFRSRVADCGQGVRRPKRGARDRLGEVPFPAARGISAGGAHMSSLPAGLITDGHTIQALACARSLGRAGYDVFVTSH